jgi:hypothetical protein
MSLNPDRSTGGGAPRVPVPEGSHVARNYAVIDLGTQSESFMNTPPKDTPKILLLFEFSKFMHVFDEKVGPQPLTISQEYSFTSSERSKLPKVLKAWGQLRDIPAKINLKPYLGQYCMLTIEHKPKKNDPTAVYSNIANGGLSVSPVPSELRAVLPQAINKNVWFDLDNFDPNVFNSLPKFVREKIMKSKEWPSIVQRFPSAGQQQQPSQQNFQQQNFQPQVPQQQAMGSTPAFGVDPF